MKPEDLDLRILAHLRENCKTPLRSLAAQLGISHVALRNRIKQMEREGIIEGYTARIDEEKLGYDIYALIQMRISEGKNIELERKVAANPNVSAVYDTTGDFDAMLLARFKSTRALDSFVKYLQKQDFVERTNTQLILNTIKEEHREL